MARGRAAGGDAADARLGDAGERGEERATGSAPEEHAEQEPESPAQAERGERAPAGGVGDLVLERAQLGERRRRARPRPWRSRRARRCRPRPSGRRRGGGRCGRPARRARSGRRAARRSRPAAGRCRRRPRRRCSVLRVAAMHLVALSRAPKLARASRRRVLGQRLNVRNRRPGVAPRGSSDEAVDPVLQPLLPAGARLRVEAVALDALGDGGEVGSLSIACASGASQPA